MALCDKLEAERDARNAKRVAVQKTALDRLLAAPDEAAFVSAWEFIARNFADLYSVPENVAELKKAILQLAVMGKLVPQDSGDQPASELLKEIEAEKKKLIKAGKIKKQEPLPPIKPEEVPYALPTGWEWVRLGEISNKITDGTHHSPPNADVGQYKYITAKNIKNDGIDLSSITFVTEDVHREIYNRCNPEKGDILYIKDGATTGVVTINDLEEEFSMLSSVALIKLPQGVLHTFLIKVMRSPLFYESIRNDMSGVAITRVTLSKIYSVLIPLPPLAEQKRIVARVDALMGLCDELEQQLKDATDKQTALLNAVLSAM
jgi:type I restriction enzyme S subunit